MSSNCWCGLERDTAGMCPYHGAESMREAFLKDGEPNALDRLHPDDKAQLNRIEAALERLVNPPAPKHSDATPYCRVCDGPCREPGAKPPSLWPWQERELAASPEEPAR